MDQFEGDPNPGKIFIRIIAITLIWIEHRESRGRTFIFIRQVMIGDDHIETAVFSPVKRLVRAYPAIDTHDQPIAIIPRLFQACLLNTVAFGETMRNMEANRAPEQLQCA